MSVSAQSTLTPEQAAAGMAEFDRTTSRWGRITMICGLILSLAGPFYLVFFADLGVTVTQLSTAFLAVAATFFIIWIIEPLTYFPILGSASMYQAFMIGNISNKLLPAALMAQSRIGAKPGTHRGSLSALMAICGAAAVHLASLLVFVGILGTWLISIIPVEVIGVIRLYVFPAVIGAVIVLIRRVRCCAARSASLRSRMVILVSFCATMNDVSSLEKTEGPEARWKSLEPPNTAATLVGTGSGGLSSRNLRASSMTTAITGTGFLSALHCFSLPCIDFFFVLL